MGRLGPSKWCGSRRSACSVPVCYCARPRALPGLYRAVFGSGCRAFRVWGRSTASIDGRSRIQTVLYWEAPGIARVAPKQFE